MATYLDYNATAPVKPAVARAMAEALGVVGNASSVHGFGREARRRIEDARTEVAALVGARPDQIVFTSGGTESNNLALGASRGAVVVAATEHVSVLAAAPTALVAPVRPDGVIDLEALAALLSGSGRPALVAVMLANNETGVIQPVGEVAALARSQGAATHSDAIQAAGKLAIDFPALGVDLMSLSAHKLGGPQGVGALVVGDRIELAPRALGGGQERRRRAGTEAVPAIVGFGEAARLARAELASFQRLSALRDELERRVLESAPEVRLHGGGAPRLPNTSCFSTAGLSSEVQVIALDLAGVAASAGAACSSGKVEPSHVLRAMGASESETRSAIRVSFGWGSRPEDIDRFMAAWAPLHARRRAA